MNIRPRKMSSPLSDETQEWLANYLIVVLSALAPAVGGLLIYRWYGGIMPANLAALAAVLLPWAVIPFVRQRLGLRTKAALLVGMLSISAAVTFDASGILGIGPTISVLASFVVLAFYGDRGFLIAMTVVIGAVWASAWSLFQGQGGLAIDLSAPTNVFGRALTMTLILSTLLFAMRGALLLVSKQTQLAQKKSDQFRLAVEELSLFIESANAPIFGIDRDGRVNEWNAMAAAITGYPKEEVLGKDLINTYITSEYKASVARVFERALSGRNTANFEFPLFSKQGRRIEVLLNATTRRNTRGEIVGVFGVGQDITSLREQEIHLRHAQKMESLGLLTGGLAHDFNNLLTVISGNLDFAQELTDSGDDTALLKNLLKDAAEASDDATKLTGQLLAFSSQQPLKLDKLNLSSLISGVLQEVSPRLGDEIKCSTDIEQVDLMVMTDRIQLENALTNLILNAAEAIEGSGTISIEARIDAFSAQTAASYSVPTGEYFRIIIRDSGRGIPNESLQSVKEPFFTTKTVGSGAGLGLSMANGFANQLSGGIRIESELDVGTSVEFVAPLIRAKPQKRSETGSQSAATLRRPGTILVVEDEPRLRSLAARNLQQSGFRVIEAENGETALETLSEHAEQIDIVFSDIRMPGEISGRRLAASVLRLYPSIRLLLTSGYDDEAPASLEHAKMPEWNVPILRKPYSKDDLVDALVDL